MKAFGKRRFMNIGQFWAGVRLLWARRGEIRAILRGKGLAPDFRERLMLAVTAVNDCRYCAFAHTRAALSQGLSEAEVNELFRGAFDGAPEAERTALIYAQHWAESKGEVEPGAWERLASSYGEESASKIDTTIRFINFCNLTGNTADWLLHSVSFGLFGGGGK